MPQDHWPHVHEPAESALIYLGCNGRAWRLERRLPNNWLGRLISGSKARIDIPVVSLKPIRMHALWLLAVVSVVAMAGSWIGWGYE